ncbi:MAG: SDR family NAD(P)-dependent oxidoreductase [Beutenbergiaceae bacterium]
MALITGGQRGIGRAIGKAFAEAGAAVGIVTAPGMDGSDAVSEFEALGVPAVAIEGDVTDQVALTAAFDAVVSRLGRLDIVVANAGIGIDVQAEDMTAAQWDRLMDVNLRGVFFTAQQAHRHLHKSGGSIVMMSSNAGFTPTGNAQAAYNISKAGVTMMAKCLAYEWGRFQIRVNAIAPGYVHTDIIGNYLQTHSDVEFVYMAAPSPQLRISTADEIAASGLFLASDAASHTNGQSVIVDGGYTITGLDYRMRPDSLVWLAGQAIGPQPAGLCQG